MPYKNVNKRTAYSREWRRKNKKKSQELSRLAYERTRDYALAYKLTHPCVDCGESDPNCLDFDHRNPKLKRCAVARLKGCALISLINEIAKCDVRCANCHRKKHAKRKSDVIRLHLLDNHSDTGIRSLVF